VDGEEDTMSIVRHNVMPRPSHAVVHNGTVYLSGQIPSDPAAPFRGQTEQVLAEIDKLVAAAGSSKSKLLSTTVYLADTRDYDDRNAVWDVWVDSANPPARTTVAAALANARWLLEIAVVAAA
jgi:enamine deaminase RidA (YjgF/YER057c/UK114 family)